MAVLEIAQENFNQAFPCLYDTMRIAQTFTPLSAFFLVRVDIKIYRRGNPPPMHVYIQKTIDNHPDNDSMLASLMNIDLSGVTVDTDGEWLTIIFPYGVWVSPNVLYALVTDDGCYSTLDTYFWKGHTADQYAGGERWKQNNEGSEWSLIPYECTFRIYSAPPPRHINRGWAWCN